MEVIVHVLLATDDFSALDQLFIHYIYRNNFVFIGILLYSLSRENEQI